MRKTTIGDKVTFTPAYMQYENQKNTRKIFLDHMPQMTGSVVYVNAAHNWFRVEYLLPNLGLQHECFALKQAPGPEPFKQGFHGRPGKAKSQIWDGGYFQNY